MNEGRWSSNSDLQDQVCTNRILNRNLNLNLNQKLEEEEVHAEHAPSQNDFKTNDGAEEEEQKEEEEISSTEFSPELDPHINDSSSLSSSSTGALSPEDMVCEAVVLHADDVRSSISAAVCVLESRGDDPALPHHLHQIAESLVQEEEYDQAIRFLRLERLYHERLLANITALQNIWENNCRFNSAPLTDLESQQLDRLGHMCRTHRQPLRHVQACKPLIKVHGVNSESCSESVVVLVEAPCSHDERMLKQDDNDDDAVPLSTASVDQAEPAHICDSNPSQFTLPLQATPTKAMTNTCTAAGDSERGKSGVEPGGGMEEEEPGEQVREVEPGGVVKEEEPGEEVKEVEPGAKVKEPLAGVDVTEMKSLEFDLNGKQVMQTGGEHAARPLPLEKEPPQEEDVEQEKEVEQEEEDIEEAIEALVLEEELQRSEVESLDDLARRIEVEEVVPAAGLVSILKRRSPAGGETIDDPSSNKTSSKRRVRFHVPEDDLEHDEVGGDSWLLLVLLCLVTVVISVGGTALYCAFGDAHSSVCTDFSHNVEFYVGKVQRSVEELAHFFSSGS